MASATSGASRGRAHLGATPRDVRRHAARDRRRPPVTDDDSMGAMAFSWHQATVCATRVRSIAPRASPGRLDTSGVLVVSPASYTRATSHPLA